MQVKFSLLSRIVLSVTLIIGDFFFVSSALAGPDPCAVDSLIARINNANSTPFTTDIIDLPGECIFTLTEVDNSMAGNNGLPVITSPIIIRGHGATIRRDPSAQRFRFFYVSGQGGDLTLSELILMNGYAYNPADPNNISANSGGAIRNAGHLLVLKSIIRRNSGREGGGIFNLNHMTLRDVTVDSNEDYRGLPGSGGIHNEGHAVIKNSTISHNGFFAANAADGIFNATGGNLEMTNSTVSGNALCGIDNEGDLTLNHVTIAFNETCAIASGGDVYTSNSIFTGSCTGIVHPTFPNVTTDASCGGPVVPIGAIMLSPLANNGGLTQTHALQPGSAAIDIVERLCLPADQRGIARPSGPQCDAGAYEYVAPPP